MELQADPQQVAALRQQLAARGRGAPGIYTLGLLASRVEQLAETHGHTCPGAGCATCDEIVTMLSTTTAFVTDNIPDLQERIERIQRGEKAELPSADEYAEAVDAKLRRAQQLLARCQRMFEPEALLLAAGGLAAGWLLSLATRPLPVAILVVGVFVMVRTRRWYAIGWLRHPDRPAGRGDHDRYPPRS